MPPHAHARQEVHAPVPFPVQDAPATEPRTDRRRIGEGTAVVVKAGVVAAAVFAVGVWFHQRVNAVEMKQVEQSTKLDNMAELLRDIRSDVKDIARKSP